MNEWISIKDRVPEDDVDVIYAGFHEGTWRCLIGYLSPYTKNILLYAIDDDYSEAITHWMPLPEPPKEK